MNTEDDTFKKLRRLPFKEIVDRLGSAPGQVEEFLESHGWTIRDLIEESNHRERCRND